MANQLEMYKKNQAEIVKQYNGKIIAVKDGVVQGDYSSKTEALRDMQKKFPPGEFLIVLCTEDDREYTSVFHSRVIFKKNRDGAKAHA